MTLDFGTPVGEQSGRRDYQYGFGRILLFPQPREERQRLKGLAQAHIISEHHAGQPAAPARDQPGEAVDLMRLGHRSHGGGKGRRRGCRGRHGRGEWRIGDILKVVAHLKEIASAIRRYVRWCGFVIGRVAGRVDQTFEIAQRCPCLLGRGNVLRVERERRALLTHRLFDHVQRLLDAVGRNFEHGRIGGITDAKTECLRQPAVRFGLDPWKHRLAPDVDPGDALGELLRPDEERCRRVAVLQRENFRYAALGVTGERPSDFRTAGLCFTHHGERTLQRGIKEQDRSVFQ